ncbi:MAG: hypothetical protein KTR16_11500 [Acidiferrobacterales bacterium]|nr:hypothetical protein [Acidiferrobacterales bacterium]
MSTLEQAIDESIKELSEEYIVKEIKVSKSDFLELYGNGLIKKQQVKDGQYSGIYKDIKIEAGA